MIIILHYINYIRLHYITHRVCAAVCATRPKISLYVIAMDSDV